MRIRALVFLGLALVVAACNPGGDDAGHTGLRLVATTGMIGDVAAEIGGERVRVETLIGAGVDPHLYKPTAADVKKLLAADIVLFNGLMLEGRMGDVLGKIGKGGRIVRAVTDAVPADAGYLLETGDAGLDPHVWMDVAGWMKVAAAIADLLAEKDPAHEDSYRERLAVYQERLAELDGYARRVLASIPEERRVLVTAHDAFGYMARAYGLEVRGIQGISTESEAGLRDINSLVDFLVERKIPAVFVETSVPRKSVEALIEGARARGHEVIIGGELFSDAMGAAGTYEGTYIGMIDHNVTTIARALGGEAPGKGFQGKLR